MSSDFLKTLQKEAKAAPFTEEDLKIFFAEKPLTNIHSLLSYHLRNNHIMKLKRGVYVLTPLDETFHFSKFSLGNLLYSPSFVSFESALAFHGLIPEAVHEVTSACFQAKKKLFKTPLGIFSFSYSPVQPFFLDVEKNEKESFLIASPIRALFDLIYLRKRIYHSLNDLEDDFRIDLNDLSLFIAKYKADEILQLGENYKKSSTRILANLLVRGLK